MAAAFIPLLVSLPTRLPLVWTLLCWSVMSAVYAPAMRAEHVALTATYEPANAAPSIAGRWTDFEGIRDDGPVLLVGDRLGRRLAFYMYGYHVQRLTPERLPCGLEELDCFAFSGVTFKQTTASEVTGLLLSSKPVRVGGRLVGHQAPSGCRVVRSEPAWSAFDCRP